jgi:predicted MFS family arabinose efflux permease
VRTGLVAAIAVSLVLPWVDLPWPYLVLVICAGIAYGVNWVPGTALLSDGAEKAGLDQALGFALLNVAWAPANVVGAALSGVLTETVGDAAAYLLAAAICLATLAAAQLAVFGGRPAPETGSA